MNVKWEQRLKKQIQPGVIICLSCNITTTEPMWKLEQHFNCWCHLNQSWNLKVSIGLKGFMLDRIKFWWEVTHYLQLYFFSLNLFLPQSKNWVEKFGTFLMLFHICIWEMRQLLSPVTLPTRDIYLSPEGLFFLFLPPCLSYPNCEGEILSEPPVFLVIAVQAFCTFLHSVVHGFYPMDAI